jgi:hypothetical protein
MRPISGEMGIFNPVYCTAAGCFGDFSFSRLGV